MLLRSARAVDRVLGWLAPRVVQAALNPAGEHKVARFGWTFAPGDKVMQMENDYDKEVYNGDIGYIVDVDPEAGEVLATFDGRPRSLRQLRCRRSAQARRRSRSNGRFPSAGILQRRIGRRADNHGWARFSAEARFSETR